MARTKTNRITLRLGGAETAFLDRICGLTGMTRSEAARLCIHMFQLDLALKGLAPEDLHYTREDELRCWACKAEFPNLHELRRHVLKCEERRRRLTQRPTKA